MLVLKVQGYLAHEKRLTPVGIPRTLGVSLRQGPRMVREVPYGLSYAVALYRAAPSVLRE